MNPSQKYSVGLIIRGPNVDPEIITERLDWDPTSSLSIDEFSERMAQEPNLIEGPPRGSWSWHRRGLDLKAMLIDLAADLSACGPELLKIRDEHDCHISIAKYYDCEAHAYASIWLDPEIIQALFPFRIGVAFTAYPCCDDPEEPMEEESADDREDAPTA